MTVISPAARLLIALLALLLLMPMAGIPLNDEATLRRFHNRTLTDWPTRGFFMRDPVGYFRQGSRWMADRAGPIVQAATIQKKILFYALKTAPQRRITLGDDGFIFVNGDSEDSVNGIFESQCVQSQSEATYLRLEHSLPKLSEAGRALGVTIHAVAVPMTSVLYADRLPRSVPGTLRAACLAAFSDETFLSRLGEQRGLNFIYPLAEMKALRNQDGFFPKANYHPRGLSVKVIRDSYLSRAGIDARIDETLELKDVASEILATYGITANYPEYVIRNDGIGLDAPTNARISEKLADLFVATPETKLYTNTGDASKTALMLTDSVGIATSAAFAAGFKRLVWVYTNEMKSQADVGKVVDRVMSIERIDTIILLLNAGSALKFATWADALAALTPR